MKNKTKNNERLARNTIRARKANKKRAHEQDKPKTGKRWITRLFALVGCLLLVSALVVPCFADYEQPIQKPIDELIVDVGYFDSNITTQVDLIGYYEIRINSIGEGSISSSIYLLQSYGLLDIIAYRISTGEYRDIKDLEIFPAEGVRELRVHYYNKPDLNSLNTGRRISSSEVTDWVFYVRQFPNLALNENQWSEFDYSVYYLVNPFEVDKVTTIWTDIMAWITNALASIQSIFYANGSLTFLGTLAVIGVSIALAWLIIGIVARFIQLRG